MEIVAELNPLTGERGTRIARNALVACYTFKNLGIAQQRAVLATARLSASRVAGHTLTEILNKRGTVSFFNFIAAGLAKEGCWPALGDEYWYPITNPFVECYGADGALHEIQNRLERHYGVVFDMDCVDFTGSLRLVDQ